MTRSRGGTREPSRGGYGRGRSTPTRRSRGSNGTSPSRWTGRGSRDLFNLSFVGNHENVLICGPVGVGKTYLANALGHTAVRRGLSVLMLRAQTLLKRLHQSRADNSFGKELVRLIHPPVLVIDDFGLQRLSPMESQDLYEVMIERYGRASTIMTSSQACGRVDGPVRRSPSGQLAPRPPHAQCSSDRHRGGELPEENGSEKEQTGKELIMTNETC